MARKKTGPIQKQIRQGGLAMGGKAEITNIGKMKRSEGKKPQEITDNLFILQLVSTERTNGKRR
jgi:hypothetical protein